MLHFVHFMDWKNDCTCRKIYSIAYWKKTCQNTKFYITIIIITKKSADILCWFQWCRKRDLNPHDCNSHTDLNRARLPIPPFLHIKLLCCPAADKAYNTTTTFKCQHFFSVFSNAYFLYFFRKTVDIMPYFWYHFFLSETIMTTHAEVSELADEQD